MKNTRRPGKERSTLADTRPRKPQSATRTASGATPKAATRPTRPARTGAPRAAPGAARTSESRARPAAATRAEPNTERLQKVMAGAGLGSRRSLESQIAEGLVLVNGKKTELGRLVKPGDRIQFRDQEWRVSDAAVQQRTLIYNKPEGEVTSRNDPDGRPTVFDHMPRVEGARWVTVGRLDINTTGLLLLTTDGELANAMMHPSNRVDREYVCRIRGMVSDEQVAQLKEGVQLDDGPARFSDIQRMPTAAGNQWFQVTLLEGRNREVRRLWEAVGCMVSRLKRVRYGAARLPRGLKVGKWSEVTPRDHRILRKDVNLPEAVVLLQLELAGEKRKGGRKPGGRRAPGATARRVAKTALPRMARPGSKPGSPAGPGRRAPSRGKKAAR